MYSSVRSKIRNKKRRLDCETIPELENGGLRFTEVALGAWSGEREAGHGMGVRMWPLGPPCGLQNPSKVIGKPRDNTWLSNIPRVRRGSWKDHASKRQAENCGH